MAVKSHVLVMSLVGGSHPAPKLKDAVLTVGDVEDAYAQTVNVGVYSAVTLLLTG